MLGLEGVLGKFVDLEDVLDVYVLVVGRDHPLLDHNPEVEGLAQQLLGLELNLLLVHLLAQVPAPCLISGHQVDDQLAALLVLANDGEGGGIVEHVCEGLGGEEGAADEGGDGRVPEGVLLLGGGGDYPRLEVLLAHVLDDVVAVGEGLWLPPVAVAGILVNDLDHDGPLPQLHFLLLLVSVRQQHLHRHCHTLLELLSD